MLKDIWDKAARSGDSLSKEVAKQFFSDVYPLYLSFERTRTNQPYLDEILEVEFGEVTRFYLCHSLDSIYYIRVFAIAKLIEFYVKIFGFGRAWKLRFALGDEGADPDVVCFCSHFTKASLIPDAAFIFSRGYAREVETYPCKKLLSDRCDKAYFRGTDSGVVRYQDRTQAPRVRLAILAKEHGAGFDCALSGVEARSDQSEAEAFYIKAGILAKRDPQERILDFRYQIDVDGNTNAWSGLFLKLLSGSPVMKVSSAFWHKQWYYDRLIAWRNYVPVRADLSDILEKLSLLKAYPDLADAIGSAGQELALSMSYDTEMAAAAALLNALTGR